MHVLITGGTGFIGRHLITVLLEQGHDITVLVRNCKKAEQFSWYPQVRCITFDLDFDRPDYKKFGMPDILFHLAWSKLEDFESAYHIDVNLPIQKKFLGELISQGMKQVFITGTCLEFGMQEGPLSPQMLTYPVVNYGKAKDLLRKWLEELHEQFDFFHLWIRLFYIYGSGQSPNSLFNQLENAVKKGEPTFNMSPGDQERDYLSINEVASFLSHIITIKHSTSICHCCSGKPITIRKFVENYLSNKNANMQLNTGYYPYRKYEPKSFWGIQS